MKKISTVYELMETIEKYHLDRCNHYETVLKENPEVMTKILIEKLLELEQRSLEIVISEKSEIDPEKSSYLSSGPTLNTDPQEAAKCKHSVAISFQATLDCVFKSDEMMDDMLDRLEHATSSQSVIDLALRLKEIQENKNHQISNFVRVD